MTARNRLIRPASTSACLAAVWVLVSSCARADERLAGIACRSVHLAYSADAAAAFYNEVTVDQSARGTYFCVCGFHRGYYGLQELADGRKLLIFSVWDPGDQNDPNAVADEQRVKLLQRDEQVRVGRFGNEGTGGQSFFDYDWKIGETYRFLVTARADGDDRTAFAAWFFVPEEKEWKHLVTFSTIDKRHDLRGLYSFVEDFRRNRVSATQPRVAQYGNGWTASADGKWSPVVKARFTADSNPATNIDAGVRDGVFFLATGGETKNEHAPLREFIERPSAGEMPADVPAHAILGIAEP
jgi:hypothetical protein